MSVCVTGVPIRNLANRKLKMRDVDPRGATYSEKLIIRKGWSEKISQRACPHIIQGKRASYELG